MIWRYQMRMLTGRLTTTESFVCVFLIPVSEMIFERIKVPLWHHATLQRQGFIIVVFIGRWCVRHGTAAEERSGAFNSRGCRQQ